VALGRNAAVQETAALISKTGGSINEVGWCFQPFRINDLELVAQIFPSWNPLTSWMRQIEGFQRAA
jgi:hypothetical protein